MENRKDHIGIPLKEGDLVAFAESAYADVRIGIVVGFTPKKIRLKRRDGKGRSSTFTKFSNQVISIEANLEIYPEFFL